MGYVYRYTDTADNIIKYVGIVWCDTSVCALKRRINQHKTDPKFSNVDWKIEYLCEGIKSRTDAEYLESHYISLYHTDKYLNVGKRGWGVSSFIPDKESEWKEYTEKNIHEESQISPDIEPQDFLDCLLSCRDNDARRKLFMGVTTLITRTYGKDYWEAFKAKLNECLNERLFGKSDGIARVTGHGKILIDCPIIGTIRLEEFDRALSVRGKRYNMDDFNSLILSDIDTVNKCVCNLNLAFQAIEIEQKTA